jgi:large subunit ribosomal protein L10
MALAIEIGYITKENVSAILAKAAQQARSVALEAGILTDDTKDQVIQKANAQAKALAGKAKNYTPQ